MDCMQWWGPQSHWFWIFPAFFMILFVTFIVFMFRRMAGHGWDHAPWNRPSGSETARHVLDRRYAAGEISKDQYDAMKRDIGGQ